MEKKEVKWIVHQVFAVLKVVRFSQSEQATTEVNRWAFDWINIYPYFTNTRASI